MTRRIRFAHIAEMALTPPTIALPADIDLSKLREEEKPVTLQIGRVGSESVSNSPNGQKRTYGQAFYESLVAEIQDKRPEGAWGHILNPKDRAEKYEAPAMRWLTAEIDTQGVVWGVGIPSTKESQDYFRVAEATHSLVGTSFLGNVTFRGNEGIAIELENLDLAHPPRTGVKNAISNVAYVGEMEEQDMPTIEELIAELAIAQGSITTYTERVAELEAQVTGEQAAQSQLQTIRQFVAESADMFARMEINITGYGDDLPKMIADVMEKLTMLQGQAYLQSAVSTVGEMVHLEALRPLVMDALNLPSAEGLTVARVAEMYQAVPTLDSVRERIKATLEKPHIQMVAKALVAEQAGPAAIVGEAIKADSYREQVIKDAESGVLTSGMGINKR